MLKTNSVRIPRRALMDLAIADAEKGDYTRVRSLLSAYAAPFDDEHETDEVSTDDESLRPCSCSSQ